MYPPSPAQLDYIRNLGYARTPPQTKREASILLTALKARKSAEVAEAALLKHRQHEAQQLLEGVRDELREMAQFLRDEAEYRCAGFWLTAEQGETDPAFYCYQQTFLPLATAWELPQILAAGLRYEELEYPPAAGRMIAPNGQVVPIVAQRRGSCLVKALGCLGVMLLAGCLLAIVAAIVSR